MSECMLKISAWHMVSDSLRPDDDIKTEFTVMNPSALESVHVHRLALLAGDPDDDSDINDDFFEVCMSEEFDLHLLARASQDIELTLEVKAKKSLADLPQTKVIRLIEIVDEDVGEFRVLQLIEIKMPIDPYIAHLKSLPTIRVLLWGHVGAGKSSIVNSISTLYNLDPDVAHAVVTNAFAASREHTVTTTLKCWKVGNVEIYDTWGVETGEEDGSNYSNEMFKNMLRGTWGDGTTMDQAQAGDGVPGDGNPMDIVLFVMTPERAQDDTLLAKYHQFMCVAGEENVKVMVALTQVDTFDQGMREDPYTHPEAGALVERMAAEWRLVATTIVPVVNYTLEVEKRWGMTRAIFVLLWRLFFTVGKACPY